MLSTRRMIGAATLLPVIALTAACTSHTQPSASPASPTPSATLQLPILTASGTALLARTGPGNPGLLTSSAVTAGPVTLQVSCLGGSAGLGLEVTSAAPGSTAVLFSIQNQSCQGDAHKVTFNPGSQPSGVDITMTGLSNSDQYSVLLSE